MVNVDEIFSKVNKQDCTKQIIIGAVSGLVSGYVFTKVGKSAAFLIGAGLIVFQCFGLGPENKSHIDWNRIERETESIIEKFSRKESSVMETIKLNRVFFGSFGGGFLIGVSFA